MRGVSLGWMVKSGKHRRRLRFHFGDSGVVRVVALNAVEVLLRAEARIPEVVYSAVDAVFPLAIVGAVTLGAQQRGLVAGDFAAAVVQVDVAVLGVMAIETQQVSAVGEHDVLMLSLDRGLRKIAGKPVVATRALERVVVHVEA